jgi:hypothetical protein
MNIDIKKFQHIADVKGYPIFEGKLNTNIWGVRSNNQNAGKFDDLLFVFETWKGVITKSMQFQVTCDPSDLSLIASKNSLGCAITKPMFHKQVWQFGFHKQDINHPALVQKNPITVIRDFNKNDILDDLSIDYNSLKKITKPDGVVEYINNNGVLIRREQTGLFGIDCHRASSWRILESVGLYSEGCTVHYDPSRYMKEFIPYIKECANMSNTFSYTLITENEYNSL